MESGGGWAPRRGPRGIASPPPVALPTLATGYLRPPSWPKPQQNGQYLDGFGRGAPPSRTCSSSSTSAGSQSTSLVKLPWGHEPKYLSSSAGGLRVRQPASHSS